MRLLSRLGIGLWIAGTTWFVVSYMEEARTVTLAHQDGARQIVQRARDSRVVESDQQKKKRIDCIAQQDISMIIEYALNSRVALEERLEALALLEECPSEQMIEPFKEYYRWCGEKPHRVCDIADGIGRALASYYRKTHDGRVLNMFADILRNEASRGGSKMDAVRVLGMCADVPAAQILKSLVLENSSYPFIEHKGYALRAVVQSGDTSILATVIEYASLILDTDPERAKSDPGRPWAAIQGIKALAVLGKNNDPANEALLEIAEKYVGDTSKRYVYRDGDVGGFEGMLLPEVGSVGREENLRLIERLVSASQNDRIIESGIKALGDYGDVISLRYLAKVDRMTDRCQEAMHQIQTRLNEQQK